MKLEIYSIYDKKSEIYHPPMYCHNDEHAKRVFEMLMSKPESVHAIYPQDFQIWKLGTFLDSTGEIKPLQNPKLVFEVSALIKKNEPE